MLAPLHDRADLELLLLLGIVPQILVFSSGPSKVKILRLGLPEIVLVVAIGKASFVHPPSVLLQRFKLFLGRPYLPEAFPWRPLHAAPTHALAATAKAPIVSPPSTNHTPLLLGRRLCATAANRPSKHPSRTKWKLHRRKRRDLQCFCEQVRFFDALGMRLAMPLDVIFQLPYGHSAHLVLHYCFRIGCLRCLQLFDANCRASNLLGFVGHCSGMCKLLVSAIIRAKVSNVHAFFMHPPSFLIEGLKLFPCGSDHAEVCTWTAIHARPANTLAATTQRSVLSSSPADHTVGLRR
mmetsp:Transcript_4428/g.12384  ORF Transcript_4428/g.12384 Transcript_4428/m.12384 type:complete len:294 (-) Transcript_4428:2239-3120(-)